MASHDSTNEESPLFSASQFAYDSDWHPNSLYLAGINFVGIIGILTSYAGVYAFVLAVGFH